MKLQDIGCDWSDCVDRALQSWYILTCVVKPHGVLSVHSHSLDTSLVARASGKTKRDMWMDWPGFFLCVWTIFHVSFHPSGFMGQQMAATLICSMTKWFCHAG